MAGPFDPLDQYAQANTVDMAELAYTNQGALRNLEVAPELVEAIRQTVTSVYGPGYRVEVMSGAQGERDGKQSRGTTGSRRHTTGVAADVWVYAPDGRRLAGDELLPLSQTWLRERTGSVGFPAKSSSSLHLDLVGGSGPGSVPRRAGESSLWYYGSPTKTQRTALTDLSFIPPAGMRSDPPTPRVMSASLQELTRGAQVPQFGYAPPMGRMSAEFGTNLPSAPNPRPRSWIDAIRQPAPATMSASLQQQTGRQPYPPLPAPAPLSFPSLTGSSSAPPSMVRPEGPAAGMGPGGPRLPVIPGLRDALTQVPSSGYGPDAPMGNNRMNQQGLGALLDPRSFSPSTPNPAMPVPGLASGGTTPRLAAFMPRPQQAPPTPQTMITGRPAAPVGSMPAARPAALSAPGAGLSPSQQLAMLAMPRPAGAIRTAGGLAGSNAQPLPGRPPSLGSPRDDIGLMPNYADLGGMMTSPQRAAPSMQAPTPATMSAALAALRNPQPARQQIAPAPATMSAALAASRGTALRPQVAAPQPAPRPQQIIRAGQHQYVLTPNGYQFADQGGFNGTGGGGSLV